MISTIEGLSLATKNLGLLQEKYDSLFRASIFKTNTQHAVAPISFKVSRLLSPGFPHP